MARKKRKWWQKKTSWVALVALINNLVPVAAIVPGIGLPVVVVVNAIAAACGLITVADRAGKSNEEVPG